jgi:ADP-heptose:LPS heptosyltransferase
VSNFKNDNKRSISLEELIEYIPLEDFEFICLQKEIKKEDEKIYNKYRNRLHFYGEVLHDFSDTAALSSCMDLVISTCTSVPHLTAAMGIKTWILLQYVPDWRWMMDRSDSPWYNSVTLFRQERMGEWGGVLTRLNFELNKLLQ